MTGERDWEPTATLAALRLRARLLTRTREFFAQRGVLEVETPILGSSTATDPHIESVPCSVGGSRRFLQTSPELFMKRLLAAGSGPIYQLSKVFRDGESGSRHSPEFTLLEWYRPGLDHHGLMDEVDELLQEVLGCGASVRETYAAAFEREVGIDPHRASACDLSTRAEARGLVAASSRTFSREDWLHLLMAEVVEPRLGSARPHFLYDFPRELSALARVRKGERGAADVAERFEVYFRGLELANGYHELTDASEQRERFLADLESRSALGRALPPIDERMIAALAHGLPPCAGVALGFDRLVMIAADAKSIDAVLSFSSERA
ncbi:MAG TPA: EF-P lysine aminoacylase EpmA [Vicinamibacteria bacterium]|nr:EF-P lysine aminoacylase EpmA [Vicinamibacteria bacterium]